MKCERNDVKPRPIKAEEEKKTPHSSRIIKSKQTNNRVVFNNSLFDFQWFRVESADAFYFIHIIPEHVNIYFRAVYLPINKNCDVLSHKMSIRVVLEHLKIKIQTNVKKEVERSSTTKL